MDRDDEPWESPRRSDPFHEYGIRLARPSKWPFVTTLWKHLFIDYTANKVNSGTGKGGVLARKKAKAEAGINVIVEGRARAKAEVEARTVAEANAIARAEAEAIARAEAEAIARDMDELIARGVAEAIAKVATETEAEVEAMSQTRTKARVKAKSRAKSRAKAKAESEGMARAEARAKASDEAKAKYKAERETGTRAKAEAKVRAEAEAEARAEAETEAKARDEAEARTVACEKAETEARAEAEPIFIVTAEFQALTTPLHHIATDCLRLSMHFFHPIQQCAQQVYHTAIPVSPTSSHLQKYSLQSIVDNQLSLVTTFSGAPDTWGLLLRTIDIRPRQLTCIATSVQGIIAACGDLVNIYDPVTFVLHQSLSTPEVVTKIQVSPDGTILFFAHSLSVTMWDVQTGGLIHTFTVESEISDLAASITGDYIACGCPDGFVTFWNIHTREGRKKHLENGQPVVAICWVSPLEAAIATYSSLYIHNVAIGGDLNTRCRVPESMA